MKGEEAERAGVRAPAGGQRQSERWRGGRRHLGPATVAVKGCMQHPPEDEGTSGEGSEMMKAGGR